MHPLAGFFAALVIICGLALSPAIGMAARSQLETRITAVLDPARPRSPIGRRLAAGLFSGVSLLVALFAAIAVSRDGAFVRIVPAAGPAARSLFAGHRGRPVQ